MMNSPDLARASSLDDALRLVIAHFGADTGTIHTLVDGMLELAAHHGGYPPQLLEIIRRIPIGKGMAGLAAERREPVSACNIQTDASGDVRPGAKLTGMEGAIVVPMLDAAGALRGTLGIANRDARIWTDAESSAVLAAGRTICERWFSASA